MYFKRHTIYWNIKKEWKYYQAFQTNLPDKIQATVAKQKTAKFYEHLLFKTWLQDLKTLSTPSKAITKRFISIKYHCFIDIRYTEWPTGGPGARLVKWEDLICQAEQFDMTLYNKLTDVCSV